MSKNLRDQVEAAYNEAEEAASGVAKEEVAEPEIKQEIEAVHEEQPAEEADIELPDNWAKEDRERLSVLDKSAKEFIVKRHKDMEAAYTKKQQSLAEEAKIADNFRRSVAPYEGYLKQIGMEPTHAFERLMATEMRLRNGTAAEKSAMLKDLARQYGVDAASDLLDSVGEPIELTPRDKLVLEALEKQQAIVNRLAETQERSEREAEYRENLKIQSSIDEFVNAKDDKGELKYPHFESVRGTMSTLVRSGIASELADAYEQAILINADLRKDYIAKQYSSVNRTADDMKRAEAAKAASFNVKSSPGSKIVDAKEKLSLRDTIKRAMDQG
jgi:hypothetical protein